MYATFCKYVFEYVPGVFLELLVAEGETAVVFVDFEDNDFNVGANLSEFRRMLNLLCPRKVRDVDETVYAFFEFYKHTEVGEVANLSVVACK